ncbi:MAG: GTPase HflX, partial [Planctomycetes bacterium]|nr:GTPase HflX [Planctomycetota bacterium]
MRGGELVGSEMAARMSAFSRETNRIVALLVARTGQVRWVVVGDHHRVYLPDIGRHRASAEHFRGIRLVRTHLAGKPIGSDDLTDLTKLRLDLVASIEVLPDGRPGRLAWAHLLPANPENRLHEVLEAGPDRWRELDFARFIADVEEEFQRKAERTRTTGQVPGMLVYVRAPGERGAPERIEEARELARTAGIELVEAIVQTRPALHPRFGVGPGKFEDTLQRALQLGVEFLVFGQDLTPRQLKSITDASDLKVIDRTQLILDIFAQHATTRAGKLQVELAQYRYMLPRMAEKGTALSRLTGGIGGRGPGETKFEVHRRRVRDRILHLERELAGVSNQRSLRRGRRQEHGVPVASIVGYTNAGKSTLLNTLTRSSVLSDNRLFSTLDPTSRRLRFPHQGEIILTDTVGFLRDLPVDLVNAFKATLEEMEDAHLLLHVVDVSKDDFPERIDAVERIL